MAQPNEFVSLLSYGLTSTAQLDLILKVPTSLLCLSGVCMLSVVHSAKILACTLEGRLATIAVVPVRSPLRQQSVDLATTSYHARSWTCASGRCSCMVYNWLVCG
eukprot:TRINITY_DN7649_c1_g1_i1.p3 TRINITY_DN7649_c1_g1~~TRINITY_DN7649_c1_g1_i1.p3  ORF type:complete len:105 (+),score=0.78 TRINITY_DN7649_c1_g1_i1:795-1109(+)